MLSSSTEKSAARSTPHPRKAEASLSVARHYSSHGPNGEPRDSRESRVLKGGSGLSKTSLPWRLSDESNCSGDPTSPSLQKWFDHSNRRPGARLPDFEDHEPPFFLPANSPSISNDTSELKNKEPLAPFHPVVFHTATNGSSVDEYRSVIDDLTIENKKLKERLRKYEMARVTHLEKDKLFEVKIHALPARRRKQLEDMLREFASSIDESTDEESSKAQAGLRLGSNPHTAPNYSSSTSTSNSRPIDSAYVSMSNSGPTSTYTLNHGGLEGKLAPQSTMGKTQNIQSFLHNIPEGLLPKHNPVMSEKQKKRLVVRRLEQLFTGNKGPAIGNQSQPLQQQEVSKSAAQADEAAKNQVILIEGLREAHIQPYPIEVDAQHGKWSAESVHETQTSGYISDSSLEKPSGDLLPEQRPTRPLDLDPDRPQIPSENVEYIRHLYLPTPQLTGEDCSNSVDVDGWIYLNLLVNMAQLHIINVTPDFVRTALSDVSEMFQLSPDGKKVRWRGGTKGTHLSSDSGSSSVQNISPYDTDDVHGTGRKWRKSGGRFADTSANIHSAAAETHPLHYKPIFHHRSSSPEGTISSDESESPFGSNSIRNEIKTGGTSYDAIWSQKIHSDSKEGRRVEDGPIVFYSGANFCIDLSGDTGHISNPTQTTEIDMDGHSNQSRHVVGYDPPKNLATILRTPSGSLLPSRPFKDYPQASEHLQTEESPASTPTLFSDVSGEEMEILVGGAVDISTEDSDPYNQLQRFEASGLGGTQPADHFAFRVETRRGVRDLLSVTTKPMPYSGSKSKSNMKKKIAHIIPASSLAPFSHHDSKNINDNISNRLTSLGTSSRPSPQTAIPVKDLPIKTEILSADFLRLEPSGLPSPTGYYSPLSTSEEDSASDSSSGISSLRRGESLL